MKTNSITKNKGSESTQKQLVLISQSNDIAKRQFRVNVPNFQRRLSSQMLQCPATYPPSKSSMNSQAPPTQPLSVYRKQPNFFCCDRLIVRSSRNSSRIEGTTDYLVNFVIEDEVQQPRWHTAFDLRDWIESIITFERERSEKQSYPSSYQKKMKEAHFAQSSFVPPSKYPANYSNNPPAYRIPMKSKPYVQESKGASPKKFNEKTNSLQSKNDSQESVEKQPRKRGRKRKANCEQGSKNDSSFNASQEGSGLNHLKIGITMPAKTRVIDHQASRRSNIKKGKRQNARKQKKQQEENIQQYIIQKSEEKRQPSQQQQINQSPQQQKISSNLLVEEMKQKIECPVPALVSSSLDSLLILEEKSAILANEANFLPEAEPIQPITLLIDEPPKQPEGQAIQPPQSLEEPAHPLQLQIIQISDSSPIVPEEVNYQPANLPNLPPANPSSPEIPPQIPSQQSHEEKVLPEAHIVQAQTNLRAETCFQNSIQNKSTGQLSWANLFNPIEPNSRVKNIFRSYEPKHQATKNIFNFQQSFSLKTPKVSESVQQNMPLQTNPNLQQVLPLQQILKEDKSIKCSGRQPALQQRTIEVQIASRNNNSVLLKLPDPPADLSQIPLRQVAIYTIDTLYVTGFGNFVTGNQIKAFFRDINCRVINAVPRGEGYLVKFDSNSAARVAMTHNGLLVFNGRLIRMAWKRL